MTWTIETVRDAPGVSAADVFRLYADPATWSTWGHNATWAQAGPLVEGGTVDVRANYGKVYPCLVRRLVAGQVLELEVRPPMLTVVQTYAVEDHADGSRVRHGLELTGRLSELLRIAGAPWFYQRLLDREVEKVIALAGSRESAIRRTGAG